MEPGCTAAVMVTLPLVDESLNRTESTLKNLSAATPFSQLTVARSQLLPFVPCQMREAGREPETLRSTVPGVEVSKATACRVFDAPPQARFAALPVVELAPLISV